MFFWDSTIILLIPALVLSIYAQAKVRSTFAKFSKMRAQSGLTGAEAARKLLDGHGISGVPIELGGGLLSDHYDPRSKKLSLSPAVYQSDSLAAVGVAAHEVGHAIQHATQYPALALRGTLVPLTTGCNFAPFIFFFGFIFQNPLLMNIGILLFAVIALFMLVTLPVELNASKRAIAMLRDSGIVSGSEIDGAKAVLNAAALTYVAAALMAILQLLRFILLSRGRD